MVGSKNQCEVMINDHHLLLLAKKKESNKNIKKSTVV